MGARTVTPVVYDSGDKRPKFVLFDFQDPGDPTDEELVTFLQALGLLDEHGELKAPVTLVHGSPLSDTGGGDNGTC
jgi:hypothetical protein